jgi:hypothetical protein
MLRQLHGYSQYQVRRGEERFIVSKRKLPTEVGFVFVRRCMIGAPSHHESEKNGDAYAAEGS